MLSRRLFVLAVTVLIPLMGLVGYGLYTERQATVQRARESVVRLARIASDRHRTLLARSQSLAEALAALPPVRANDWPVVAETLKVVVHRFPEYPNVRISALDGSTVATARPHDPIWNNRGREWFDDVVRTGDYSLGGFFVGQGTAKPSIVIGYPIRNAEGQVTHVLSLTIDLTNLAAFPANELPAGSIVTVIGRSGTILAQSSGHKSRRGNEVDASLLAALRDGPAEGVVFSDRLDIGPSLVGYVELPVAPGTEGLYVAVGVPWDQVLAPVSRAASLSAGGVLLVFGLVLGIGAAASRRLLLAPVQGLVDVLERLAAGDLRARASEPLQRDRGELGRLARSLTTLGSQLQRRENDQAIERERLRSIFDAYFGFAVLLSPAHVIEEVNETSLRLTGLTRTDVVGRPFTEAGWFTNLDAASLTAVLDRAFAGESVRVSGAANLPRLGDRLLDAAFAPIRNAEGSVVHVVGFGVDITERSRAEIALRESERRLREAQQVARFGNWDLDIGTGQLFCSDEIFRLFEIDPSHLESPAYDALLEMVHPEDREMARRAYAQSRHAEEPYGFVHRVRMADGRIKHVEAQCETKFDANGRPLRSVGTIHDVTERVLVEEALRASETTLEQRVIDRTRELEASNRELEAFSYAVSHDLRAPLRAIDGFSQTLIEDEASRMSDAGRADLARIRRAAERMGNLIDALLQLSRLLLEPMDIVAIDLSEKTRQIVEELRESNPSRSIEVHIEPDLAVRGDRRLLRAAMTNLLSNAFKFTSHVENARLEVGRCDVDGTYAFYVRDNGAGFDMAYANKLFVPFERLHRMSEFPGTGIGLTTVQRIVHRHGGRIWAESRPGEGATFFFVLDQPRHQHTS